MEIPSKDMQVLQHILDHAYDVKTLLRDWNVDEYAFKHNFGYRNAISMSLMQIGECAKHLSDAFCQENKQIPWKSMIGMRNFYAHEYGKMDVDMIWGAASRDVSPLIDFCESKLVENGVPLPEPKPLDDSEENIFFKGR